MDDLLVGQAVEMHSVFSSCDENNCDCEQLLSAYNFGGCSNASVSGSVL